MHLLSQADVGAIQAVVAVDPVTTLPASRTICPEPFVCPGLLDQFLTQVCSLTL